ncbi:MAG: 1-(5-phosphoribosyl)-5-[(5-phosphoribosylamino)methylideneamino]imidazole-4-carboxamide isomerase [Rhodospirillales bacterium]|nr:1-(5-phosphoribosyl)-5-[(5-phosphoribosylamino)methylideneamino]imidazole-4-carboxamide isomerase [Rhodospirillales bacterium]MCB9965712.1 1-(5-phosphoribosyl)-5-[(5-phosphoribosylamino)methylideneamino]imidazole-4-carboxamide isomerase [Rhodospirillales bacterium]MCB9980085.1 1-(5-phosphoribosyl)-5-[(5-phosphoribosylamino)methylideneamino]imidazole-4-carboxamide isomerase [Rhodospirillales bacterium]
MIIYPAIDLKDGQCVRLYQGDMNDATLYNPDPAAQAQTFARDGFSHLHIVDLNGAIDGAPVNRTAVEMILQSVDLPVQLGGGIRTLQHIEDWLEAGVNRVILGTLAVKNPDLVREACARFPGRIVLGLDARKEKIAVEGWIEDSETTIFDMAQRFEDAGAAAIIYTDITRDGTEEGVNLKLTQKLAESIDIPVIASGGIGSMAHVQAVRRLQDYGVSGLIIGRALYEQRLNIAELTGTGKGSS